MGLFLIFLFMLPRSSAQSALLDEVTRQARGSRNSAVSGMAPRRVNADLLAKPFTLFRRLFSTEPDPDLVRRLDAGRLSQASPRGYFSRCKVGLAAVLGHVWSRFSVSNNTIFLFLLTMVVGFLHPGFLAEPCDQEAERKDPA